MMLLKLRPLPVSNSGRIFIFGAICGYIVSLLSVNVTDSIVQPERKFVESRGASGRSSRHIEAADTRVVDEKTDGMKNHRILCWVLTSPGNALKANIVKSTWGRKCDKLLFMSSKNDSLLGAVGLPVEEIRNALWEKVTLSVRHLHENYLNEYDWFFKADDDTYTIVENLRHFLSPFNSSLPFFFGREFKYEGVTYRSGGAGYLLSREALRRVVELGLNTDKCQAKSSEISEDVNMGKCVKAVDGIFGDSKDKFGRQRFIPYKVNEFYSGGTINIDFMKTQGIEFKLGFNCCSKEAITFHYISGYDMQVYEGGSGCFISSHGHIAGMERQSENRVTLPWKEVHLHQQIVPRD